MKGYYQLENPSFDDWRNRAVFITQCHTSRIASLIAQDTRNICAITPELHLPVLFKLRVLPAYRCEAVKAFRKQVADAVRLERSQRVPQV